MGHEIAKVSVPACPTCGQARRRFLYPVREHEYSTTTDEEFSLFACSDCDTWFLDPRPDASALSVIYPADYYANIEPDAATATRTGPFNRLAMALYRSRLKPIERFVELNAQTRWLEVGCGSGKSLEALRSAFGVQHSTGIDISEIAVKRCRTRGFQAIHGLSRMWIRQASGASMSFIARM
jgi:SAM-dependent methyltransferase